MSYKVKYYTLAKMDDGSIGNVRQSGGEFYTDIDLAHIQTRIDGKLESKKQVAIITNIEKKKGFVLF
jgi:hypothetical protein